MFLLVRKSLVVVEVLALPKGPHNNEGSRHAGPALHPPEMRLRSRGVVAPQIPYWALMLNANSRHTSITVHSRQIVLAFSIRGHAVCRSPREEGLRVHGRAGCFVAPVRH